MVSDSSPPPYLCKLSTWHSTQNSQLHDKSASTVSSSVIWVSIEIRLCINYQSMNSALFSPIWTLPIFFLKKYWPVSNTFAKERQLFYAKKYFQLCLLALPWFLPQFHAKKEGLVILWHDLLTFPKSVVTQWRKEAVEGSCNTSASLVLIIGVVLFAGLDSGIWILDSAGKLLPGLGSGSGPWLAASRARVRVRTMACSL